MAQTFLDELTEKEAADLRAAGRQCGYGAAVTIVHEGDDAGPVVVLLRGRAKGSAVGGGGRGRISPVPGPGALIGELSAVADAPRSASVTTLEPVDALLLPGSRFAA